MPTETLSKSGQHGGRRPGAGRPRSFDEPMLRRTINLPQSYIEALEWEGNGNLSEGIRFLVACARLPGGGYWLDVSRPEPTEA